MIVALSDLRPHVTIHGKESAHVCPVAMFRDIADGKLKPSDVEDIDDLFPPIIKEWLERF